MKKLLSLVLALSLCLSLGAMLSSCDLFGAKGAMEELNEEEWQEALSAPNFENVTIKYEYTHEGMLYKQIAKFTKDGVYRSNEATQDGASIGKQEHFFTGTDADTQRNLFLQTFLAIVKDRNNFEYNKDEKIYFAEKASVRVDQAEGLYVEENITNGKLSFTDKGNVDKFVCTLNEVAYVNNEKNQDITIDVTWNFSDYGTTTITAEEQANGSK